MQMKMPSLRQRVSTYFRQLSFIAEPHRGVDSRFASTLSPRNTPGEGCFITKYLEGQLDDRTSNGSNAEILHGKEPTDLPDLRLSSYDTGPDTVVAACTGPDEGLTTVKRSRMHLSLGDDIDFIDTSEDLNERKSVPKKPDNNFRLRYQNMIIKKPDQNANKEITSPIENQVRPRKLSRSDSKAEESTTIHQMTTESRTGGKVNIIVRMISTSLDNAKVENGPNSDNINKNVEIRKENVSPNDNVQYSIKQGTNDNKASYATADAVINCNTVTSPDEYAGISNWHMENDNACGMSVSLYETNMITKESTGNPIADCYGLVVRGNSIAMSLADGVNWGEGACLAARSAVQGSLEYLDKAVFGQVSGSMARSTREIFVSLLRSFWSAHACILETGGSLTTLTVAVILPLADAEHAGKSVVCCCNVGDSLGYVYNKERGVREFTQGSHDVNIMRDMRDALGALGPVDGMKPELGNLTLSMTIVEANDIVFLTSDGISDNFDPVVGKFADAITDENNVEETKTTTTTTTTHTKPIKFGLAPKRENKSTSSILGSNPKKTNENFQLQRSETQPIRPIRRLKKGLSTTSATASHAATDSKYNQLPSPPQRPKFLRSQTVIEPTRNRINKSTKLKYSAAGLPLVLGAQRHTLTLLRIEDLLSYGINGMLQPNLSARKVCSLLIDFARMITSAKRKMLEQRELFYKVATVVAPPDSATGTSSRVVKKEIEMNRLQQRAARKRVVDGQTFSQLPGKLDHATVVAVRVPSVTEGIARHQETSFVETNF